MIDVINLQRKTRLDSHVFRKYVQQLSSAVDDAKGKTFSVAFVSDKRMIELNKFFRGKDTTTDVLSFPYKSDQFIQSAQFNVPTQVQTDALDMSTDFLGDIVVSAEQAAKQAKENKLSLENEIKQLILHGLLHLCGYDHETDNGEMAARELELRDKLSIS